MFKNQLNFYQQFLIYSTEMLPLRLFHMCMSNVKSQKSCTKSL